MKTLSKWDFTTKIIAVINAINCSISVLHVREKRKWDTYLRDIQHSMHNGKPVKNIVSNKYDHQNLVIALLTLPSSTILRTQHKVKEYTKILSRVTNEIVNALKPLQLVITPKLSSMAIKYCYAVYQLLLWCHFTDASQQ